MKEREFLQKQLNTDKLSPLQQQGIEIAMRKYAEWYHNEELSKLSQHDVIKNEVAVCCSCEMNLESNEDKFCRPCFENH